ncbi:MAG: filamentous hemagglutinin N-terminal domain-containing protein [Pelatocladus maniniholoensis HA4357-MV3]|jgi:filamentous hemagglutinin family protein|uniref:Filamentous hemagglutinin N-terminal domain-containing protein n=1 Tax=Pelatocladus maniniholoensis HA4357-MV3 TaxID=1117104 RepID=A0A9E3HFA6_9NOST|nr:filamentous hemagglutinin N-terminal domain-containing protein [Pelatocladus maniniholoensis HA4357-MV3]
MKQLAQRLLFNLNTAICCIFASSLAQAQISPDGTLPTSVNQVNNSFEITGGTQAGSNLFHSFREFSVPTGSEAFFKNNANTNSIVNIINRVTGGSISNIDGLIKENYGANLILINPSGINFGHNAQLNIGGSFLGSTANTIKFADGTEFSATNIQNSPLLTISVPVGLQFGQNPAAINVQGQGHNLAVESQIFSPFTRGDTTGLKVQPGQTLALVGGDITLDGGVLVTEGGRIELGSVGGNSFVNLAANSGQVWSLGYTGVPSFKDIDMRSRAITDTSGVGSGSIQLQGRNITLQDGSAVLIQTQGTQSAGNINVNASESLKLIGTTPDGQISTNIFTETIGDGKSGDINITTPRLVVQDGAVISAATYTPAPGGNISVNAAESLEVIGYSSVNPNRFSTISAATYGAGNAGTLTASTKRVTATGGGNIASITAGTGSGGNVVVNASELVELVGFTPFVFAPSQITAGTGGPGAAGNVMINTQRLIVKDGGRVDASTLASGSAGSITINANDSIEVSGTVPGSVNPSLIVSSANIVDPTLQQLLRLPPYPSGASGDVTINTGKLNITDGALITASNSGSGTSGNIRINARSVFLDNGASITSELGTANAIGQPAIFSPISLPGLKGGDIAISSQQLDLRGGAKISTSTFTNATGGNINVNAPESVQVFGVSPINPASQSLISASTFGSSNSGNVTVSTGRLSVFNGGLITAGTFGTGSGGDVTVNATEAVEVIGVEPSRFLPSIVGVSTFNAGNAGNLTITAPKVVVRDGGKIDASTFSTGSAGNVTINAPESVEVTGTNPGSRNSSVISSGATIENETIRQILRVPPVPSGASGDVIINTGKLRVTDGGLVTTSNQGTGISGDIKINAQSVFVDTGGGITSELGGTSRGGQPTFFSPFTVGGDMGGDIDISAQQLILQGGAGISTATFTNSAGGNVNVDVSGLVQVEGFATFNPRVLSLIGSSTFGSGRSGNVNISTGKLQVLNGARIGAGTFGSGSSGNSTINATESVQVIGKEPSQLVGSLIGVSTLNIGNGGDLTINTPKLIVQDGGRVDSSTAASGSAGNVTINASKYVEVNGTSSLISAGANIESEVARQIFRLPPVPSGASGDVTINTPRLSIKNEGQVNARNEGTGNAGSVRINTNSTFLDNRGSITAATTSGEGGNIFLQTNSLAMRRDSQISAEAGGSGNGGNITITGFSPADFVVLLEGSKITANAFQGMGGNISINTQGLFVCPECQISASSQLGVDGQIEILTPNTSTNQEVLDLPQEITKPEEIVAQVCPAEKKQGQSEFIITGRGGLPPRPSEPLSSEALLSFESYPAQAENISGRAIATKTNQTQQLPPIARGWYVNSKGAVILTSATPTSSPYSAGLSSSSCHAN